jgi:hypothetical protein
MKSILQDEKKCYVSGATENLHKHHIFKGGRRKASDKWGCWVWLRADWHNMSDYGVHFNPKLDSRLKCEAQAAFEKLHGHQKFMDVFGKNYLP